MAEGEESGLADEFDLDKFLNHMHERADHYLSTMIAAFSDLASEWKYGRAIAAIEPFRFYHLGSQNIFFRREEARIVIVRVLHDRMDPARRLKAGRR